MSVYKLSNVGGLKTKTAYTSFLAGNSQYVAPTYEAIATTTLASSTASITFSSIPQTYTHLQIRGIGRGATGGESAIFASFNGTGGNGHALYGNGSITGSYQETQGMAIGLTPTNGSGSSVFGAGVADILDYSNTNKFKTVRALSGTERDISGGNSYIFLQSSLWQSTNAITSITLTINGGNNFTQYSSFALYGIRSV